MLSEPVSPVPATPTAWPILGLYERRALGVLVEKAKTTPDAYPLSLNAVVTGCNQKSNREPALNLSDDDAEEALTGLQKQGLTMKLTGSSRVPRWRHLLYEAWHVDKVELAVLAELLLRGPQTEGELRGRASRMEEVADLDALRVVLRPLVERRLVVYLTPEGRRGTVLTHGFHAPDELEGLRARHGADSASSLVAADASIPPARSASSSQSASASALSALESQLSEARAEIADLRKLVTELQTTVIGLSDQLRLLKDALGA